MVYERAGNSNSSSRLFPLATGRQANRVVGKHLCLARGRSIHLPPGSCGVLAEEGNMLLDKGVGFVFQHYEHPEYCQLFPPFLPYASILDLIFNEGERSLEILRSGRRASFSEHQAPRADLRQAESLVTSNLKIGERTIGPGHPVYVVAELSANHHQEFEQAVRILHAAKAVGADAVKLQTYTPDTITIRSDQEYFRIGGGTLWDGRTLYDLYGEAHTAWEWQPKLKQVADDLELDLFSSPFDSTAVDFLEGMGVPAYKLASCELVDIGLIQKMARTGKPLIISTGMATVEEIEEALNTARDEGCTEIALLKCTSSYPALPDEMNLRTIPELARRFQVPVGLSDHTTGIAVPVVAVALGACIIEKHITLALPARPRQRIFARTSGIQGHGRCRTHCRKSFGRSPVRSRSAEESTRVFRRSLFIVEDVRQGQTLTSDNVRSIRPGHGLHTRHLPEVIGQACRAGH